MARDASATAAPGLAPGVRIVFTAAMRRFRYLSFWLLVVTMAAVTGVAAAFRITAARAVLLGFDAGALVFIVGILRTMSGSRAEAMRERAAANDPDQNVLLAIALLLVGVVMAAVAIELTGYGGGHGTGTYLAAVTILLVWLFANLLLAVHYAHLFYAPGDADDAPTRGDGTFRDAGGLDFPGDAMPTYGDFAYFSFVIGMTFQVSDVQITSRSIRQLALFHAIAAFLFDIIVVALTISAIGSVVQK